MNRFSCFAILTVFCLVACADQPAYQVLFDGKTLDGWEGKPTLWSVQDGVIVGQTIADAPIDGNTFLVWQGGDVGDFEFRCLVRFDAVNSGVQYRSKYANKADLSLAGYQADLHPKREYLGMMYGEKTGLGIIATGGQRLELTADGKKNVTGKLEAIPPTATDQWNELRIVAVGNRMVHQINGVTTVDVTDNRPDAPKTGLLGLQLHKGKPMKAEFKSLRLRQLAGAEGATAISEMVPAESSAKGESGTSAAGKPSDSDAADASEIYSPDGFVVERIYTTTKDQGSWVSLATDPQGRLYACDQGKAGLYRITLPSASDDARGSNVALLVEKVSVGPLATVSSAQGLTWAFDSLWCHTNGGNLLRLSDSDGDDVLDAKEIIPGTTGGGEHGNHAVMQTEDGKALYMVGGNAAPLAEHVASTVPTWYEGQLIPRMWDTRGHARDRKAPGGWITRLDPETHEQTVRSIGYRNEYDIALNQNGDLFTYDADMEWDIGLPWYRPTRICQAVSGSDYGWRSGSGKWPTYYEDSLPPVVEIGPGSPTGLVSGQGAHFPSKYQDALFALDWTFGTMYAIHMVPDGAGYRGEAEPFIYSTPLPLTDAVVGEDGNMYFTIGGRGMASGLFRVRYVGDSSCEAPAATGEVVSDAVQQCRALEAFHGVEDSVAIETAWPFLSSEDRFLRHAARIAVESQPLETWATRVATEANPQARITASVALARMGNAEHLSSLLQGLLSLNPNSLDDAKQLGLLRAYALAFDNLNSPTDEQRTAVVNQLRPLMPHSNVDVTTELIRVLAYLRDETLPAKVLELIEQRSPPELPAWSELAKRSARYGPAIKKMLEAHPPTLEVLYAFMLRNLRSGWTLDQRRSYFGFINEAAKASGGASYAGYLTRIRDESLATCSDTERKALEDITGEDFNPVPDFPIVDPVGPGQQWTVKQAMSANRGPADFKLGRSLYFSGKCAACHRLGGLGGSIGPDLTSVRNKFDDNYLVEAIIHPSKHISDQYGSSRVLTDHGQLLVGLVIEQDNGDLTVYPIDENAKAIKVEADAVEMIEPSKVSQMPEGLLDRLNAEEVRDLVAYIMSGGDSQHKRYVGKKK